MVYFLPPIKFAWVAGRFVSAVQCPGRRDEEGGCGGTENETTVVDVFFANGQYQVDGCHIL